MDIRVFDRNSDIAPLLVDLYDTHETYKITHDKTPNDRAELTTIISNLFKTELSFSEQEIIDALKLFWHTTKLIIEPSCAVVLAAIMKFRDQFESQRVGVVLSGGNIDLDNLPW